MSSNKRKRKSKLSRRQLHKALKHISKTRTGLVKVGLRHVPAPLYARAVFAGLVDPLERHKAVLPLMQARSFSMGAVVYDDPTPTIDIDVDVDT